MIFFVYRTHYEGPLSKRVRELPDATVLDWFRRGWAAVVTDQAQEVDAWLTAELGDDVYGLHTIFDRAREHGLAAPQSWQELRDLLEEHLYYEGELRVDAHSVRVLTDDDEVMLPYFFFDSTLADQASYLLHDDWPLPFDAVEVSAEDGPGMVHVVLLTHYDGDSVCWQPPFAFPGVRLPDLAAHLRTTTDDLKRWPGELLVLRALVAPGEEHLGAALERCNRWPSYEEGADELYGTHEEAHRFAMGRLADAGALLGRDVRRTLVRCDEHLAQMAIHMSDFFGYQQWFVFDDAWTARHEDLARSLLRYGTEWDPFD
ncbi:hypothetical protein Pth03_60700 [Planotetraspora thailandica]|uniref:Uncharacterized protein n=1 Tax=Planotetraspora thailandica TaxID=487172 RepID=A0A8J3XYS4_9ACTN|nr:hypothetical protein [Planotetraspora thailandica]GII57681.1 hypothetical protein Pth03_60700 [Planotetraspora thailandica]